MKEQLISQIVPLIITCVVGIIAAVVKAVGDAIVAYIKAKQDEVIKNIGIQKYEEEKAVAKDIWNIVEEHFRINETVGDKAQKKVELFNQIILNKIPYLTQEQIDFLRQAVAGEVNKGKDIVSKS